MEVERILKAHPYLFGEVLENVDKFNLQVLVSEVRPEGLLRGGFRLDRSYFYPASSIKLCAAVAALQKLKHLTKLLGKAVMCTTPLSFYPLFEGEAREKDDDSNLVDGKITVAHEIRKLFLVSDNRAFNRLYDLVGHRSLNHAMWAIGLHSTRLQHRLSDRPEGPLQNNGRCRAVQIDLGDGISATIPPKKSGLVLSTDNTWLPGIRVGTARVAEDNELIHEPMDFSKKNRISLLELQTLLIKIMRRDVELEGAPLDLDENSRLLLHKAMAQYPGDSSNPKFNRDPYPDDYCKFFLPGLCRVRSKGSLRIYNKVGRAFGFSIDNAYIVDVETGRSFFLSATIYTNANGVLNDDQYEYQIADRVLADIAEVMARAIWQIPPAAVCLSTALDCIPSSLWEQHKPADEQAEPLPRVAWCIKQVDQRFCYFLDE